MLESNIRRFHQFVLEDSQNFHFRDFLLRINNQSVLSLIGLTQLE